MINVITQRGERMRYGLNVTHKYKQIMRNGTSDNKMRVKSARMRIPIVLWITASNNSNNSHFNSESTPNAPIYLNPNSHYLNNRGLLVFTS